MFQVVEFEDKAIRILPQNLALSRLEAITQQVEATYVDKVVPDVGLCVTLYEITKVEGGAVYHAEGSALFSVHFSLVVFRPFVGEVLTGRIKSADAYGLRVSLGFFDDVHILAACLQEPSSFDEGEALWKWNYDGNEMFFDIDEEIRFRVQSVRFPRRPISVEALSELTPENGGMPGPQFAAMVVLGELNGEGGAGMGLLSWWPEEA